MQYRSFPKIDFKPSALGFGAMRLPIIGNDPAKVNVPEAVRMMRYAIDRGVNYVDTAYFYHGGFSEQAVGAALKDGYREKVKLATKFPAWYVKSSADFDKVFAEQLARLGTDRVDFYLLHGLGRRNWTTLRDMGVVPWMEKQVANGRVGHIGFSFHDDYDVFKEIVDYTDKWTFCQLQYNYMDVNYQAGRAGVEYAASKRLGVIIMEPLRGGQLAKEPPEAVRKAWKTDPQDISPVEWALRWLWNQPEISLILSGMSNMQQVIQNVDIAERMGNTKLNKNELALIERVREAYQGACPISCTGCRYCMPCPNNVEVPVAFRIYNEMHMYSDTRMAKARYNGGPWGLRKETDARNCVECGQCAEHCPQHLPIPELLKKVHKELAKE
jgi:uncharacterized protein